MEQIEHFLAEFRRVRKAAESLPPSVKGEAYAMLQFAATFFDAAVSSNKPELVSNEIMAAALKELQAAGEMVAKGARSKS